MDTMGALVKTMRVIMYAVGIFMIYAGFTTMFLPLEPLEGDLGAIFGNRVALVALGLWFASSGAALIWGKYKKRRRLVSNALMSTYLCFLFSSVLVGLAVGSIVAALPNFFASIGVGILWLWWRFKTEYLDLGEMRELRRYLKH